MPTTVPALVRTQNLAERRLQALNLRTAGASYRTICRQLGISHAQAQRDVVQALADRRVKAAETADMLVELEIERLDVALLALSHKVRSGHLGAISLWIKLSETRRKLLGIDGSSKLQIDVK